MNIRVVNIVSVASLSICRKNQFVLRKRCHAIAKSCVLCQNNQQNRVSNWFFWMYYSYVESLRSWHWHFKVWSDSSLNRPLSAAICSNKLTSSSLGMYVPNGCLICWGLIVYWSRDNKKTNHQKTRMTVQFFTGIGWYQLVSVGISWYQLVSVGISWYSLV